MSQLPKNYCTACSGPLISKIIEGHSRLICAACSGIQYQNPIPVAAALVFNPEGEILLVKRLHPPQAGMWCLPMGFAEVSETIEQSALRELKEETGIKGKIVSLLDATSHIGDFYGNTITISFLVKMTGGILKAGDDAADAKWFPLCDLPPLAFESNRNALNAWESFKQNLHKSD